MFEKILMTRLFSAYIHMRAQPLRRTSGPMECSMAPRQSSRDDVGWLRHLDDIKGAGKAKRKGLTYVPLSNTSTLMQANYATL